MGIFMGRTVPSADPSTVWLADLIEAAEVLAASAEELDRRLAILNSKRGLFENLLDGVRRMDDSRSSNPPTLWQRRLQ
jgi:hypothetical protein